MSKIAKTAALVALILILLSAAGIAGGLYTRFTQTNKNRAANARIWHAVICDIQKSVVDPQKGQRKLSPTEQARFLAFYDRLLVVDAHAAPCGIKVTGR